MSPYDTFLVCFVCAYCVCVCQPAYAGKHPFNRFRDVWVRRKLYCSFLSSTFLSTVPCRGLRSCSLPPPIRPPSHNFPNRRVHIKSCMIHSLCEVFLTVTGPACFHWPPYCFSWPCLVCSVCFSDLDKKRILELYNKGQTAFEQVGEPERRCERLGALVGVDKHNEGTHGGGRRNGEDGVGREMEVAFSVP